MPIKASTGTPHFMKAQVTNFLDLICDHSFAALILHISLL